MSEQYLTVGELAQKLRVPKSWVYSQTRKTGAGSLPRIKLGKYLRFEWELIQQWAQDQTESQKRMG